MSGLSLVPIPLVRAIKANGMGRESMWSSSGTRPNGRCMCPKRNHRYFQIPHPIQLHLVVIRETDLPLGVEPLLWALFTSLPVATWELLR